MKKKYRISLSFLVGFWVMVFLCANIIKEIKDKEMSIIQKKEGDRKTTIEQIKAKYEMQLLSIEGVVGVGIGEELGKPVINVYVVKKTKSLEKKIPTQIEGYPVRIEVTGEIHAF